jgi:hypothetical protein
MSANAPSIGCMKGQLNLFVDLPPPADKPIRFKPAERPIWTENKAKLIERYLFYFVLITKHGAYIDGFAGPQYDGKEDAWAAKLVLESKPAFLRNFWLCDIDPKDIAKLEALKAAQPKIRNRTIEIVPGDFNANVSGLLATSSIDDKSFAYSISVRSNASGRRWSRCHGIVPPIRSSCSISWPPAGLIARWPASRISLFWKGGGVALTTSNCRACSRASGCSCSVIDSRTSLAISTPTVGKYTARKLAAGLCIT